MSPDITLTIRNMEDLRRLEQMIADAPDEIRDMCLKWLDWGGYEITTEASMNAPKDTGYLAGSISHIVTEFTLQITVGAPYGSFVEYGHRTRGAKKTGLLTAKWRTKKGRFTTYVEGEFFLSNAVDKYLPEIFANIEREISEYLWSVTE